MRTGSCCARLFNLLKMIQSEWKCLWIFRFHRRTSIVPDEDYLQAGCLCYKNDLAWHSLEPPLRCLLLRVIKIVLTHLKQSLSSVSWMWFSDSVISSTLIVILRLREETEAHRNCYLSPLKIWNWLIQVTEKNWYGILEENARRKKAGFASFLFWVNYPCICQEYFLMMIDRQWNAIHVLVFY